MKLRKILTLSLVISGALSMSVGAQSVLEKPTIAGVTSADWGLSQRDLNIASGANLLEKAKFSDNRIRIEAAAEGGDAIANLLIGLAYQNGIGYPKDEEKAAKFMESAAKSGNSRAMFSLGFFFENGIGFSKSLPGAANWYRKSAALGNARGMFSLGQFLSLGTVLPKNDNEAAQLFRKSAEAGFDPAMVALGYALSDGVGVDIDQQAALKWYRVAADLGNPGGMLNVGIMYHAGRGVRQDFVLAHDWYKKSAVAGNMDGMFSLAKSYAYGEGVAKDQKESDRWVQEAAKAGHTEASSMVHADLAKQSKVASAMQPTTTKFEAPVNRTSQANAISKIGWDVSSLADFTIAIPQVQPIYGRTGYNCSSGIFQGIVVFVPSDFPLFDSVGRPSNDLKTNLFVKLAKLTSTISAKADRRCSNLFDLSVVRIGIYDYCLKNSIECSNGFLPSQHFRECPNSRRVGIISGICASRYDIGIVRLSARGGIERGITLSAGPQTLALKIAERDMKMQAQNGHAAEIQADAVRKRLIFQRRSLSLVTQPQKAAVTAVLSHMVAGGSPCFNVYDGERVGLSGKGIQLCDKFTLSSFSSRAVSGADSANGITKRISVKATYIYTQSNSVSWTDASICMNVALNSAGSWRVVGSCF